MKQSDLGSVPVLSDFRYENFLNVYQDVDGQYFYNLLQSINIIPPNTDDIHDFYTVGINETWVYIAYKHYKTIELWWLICAYNQIIEPGNFPLPGTVLKILKPQYVSAVITALQQQVNQ